MEGKKLKFGSRFLLDKTKVLNHNAWDNVEWDDEDTYNAEQIILKQKCSSFLLEDRRKLINESSVQWDLFYAKHKSKFFMNRNWLTNEFDELNLQKPKDARPIRIVEVGCGVGNSLFPILESNRGTNNLFMYACDFSSNAVDIVKKNASYDEDICKAFIWDVSGEPTIEIEDSSIDIVLCIYVLSAIPPEKQQCAINNLVRLLRPGGKLLLKDYGMYDLTQLRFKTNRYISDNYYCRGDGTLVYYFTREKIDNLFENSGLKKESNIVDRRMIVNRAREITMKRVWLQCKYVKPIK